MRWRSLLVGVGLLLVGLDALAADAVAAKDALRLQRIDHAAPAWVTLQSNSERPQLLVFFEDDCRYCITALRTDQMAQGEAPGKFELLAVGIGNRRALVQWLRRAQLEVPIVHASTRLLAAVGGVRATPTWVTLNADSQPIKRAVGSLDPAQFAANFPEL